MKLALSTAAAPDFTVTDLLDACERRGLAAIELVSGDLHGVGPGLEPRQVEDIVQLAAARGIRIAGWRARDLQEAAAPETVRLAFGLGAPVILGNAAWYDEDEVLDAARRYSAVGVTLLLEHGSDPDEVERLSRVAGQAEAGTIGLAWRADPTTGGLDNAAEIIAAARPLLRHILLHGGGPESAQGEGQGIGSLMGRLTLAHYGGHIAIAPSTSKFHVVWNAWLGRGRGGWGCGSKQSDDALVSLG